MTAYTFNQLFDFTRTTSATFVGSNGLIQTTPASVNLLTYTQEFDNAVWTKTNTTVTANSLAAPDGTVTADTLTASAAAGAGQQTFQTITTIGTGNYVFSIYVKQGSGATDSNLFLVRNQTTGVNPALISFNYQTGVVTQTDGYGATAVSAGNGWWRIVIPFTLTATVGDAIRFYTGSSGAVETPGEFFYVWGAQVEFVPDANLVLGSELRGDGVVSTIGTPSPLATYNSGTGAATLNRVDGGNVSGVRIPVGGAGRTIRVSVTIISTSGTAVQVRGTSAAGTVLTSIGSTAGTYLVYVVSDTADIYLTMGGNASTASITIDSVKQITGVTGTPTTYTRNNGGVYPARFDYDPVTLAPKGILIEEQRTNLVTYSNTFSDASWIALGAKNLVANSTVSPDGETNASTLTDNSAVAYQGIQKTVTIANDGATYVASIYVRKTTGGTSATFGINLQVSGGTILTTQPRLNTDTGVLINGTGTVQNAGAYWRLTCSITNNTTGNTTLSLAVYPATAPHGVAIDSSAAIGSAIIYGAQLEAGAFPTSYIPTVASQVSRSADVCAITAPMFAPWYKQSEGTWVAQFSGPSGGYALNTNDGTNNNATGLVYVAASTVRGITVAAGTGRFVDMTAGATPIVNKTAYGYKANDLAGSTNGGAVVTNATAVIPTLTQMFVGTFSNFSFLNGHIRSIRYFPFRVSNNQLVALTS
jgi:hypothetical protein